MMQSSPSTDQDRRQEKEQRESEQELEVRLMLDLYKVPSGGTSVFMLSLRSFVGAGEPG